jgi:hypothetical protein
VAWIGLSSSGRRSRLREWPALGTEAAAAALTDTGPKLAILHAEQGRAVMWTQALALRTEPAALAHAAPGLASRLREVNALLAAPSPIAPADRALAEDGQA